MEKERIQWLAVLRGLNIVLVVMFHVQLINMATGENHLFCTQITSPFNPIRMPLFIFCSGGLLYLSRIRKNWETRSLYVDKFYRIVCPLLFFVIFYFFFKALFNPFVKTKVVLSLGNFLESFAIYPGHPSSNLWFLAVLMWFMLLYPVFCRLCRSNVRMVVFLLFSMVIYLIGYFTDIDVPVEYNYFYIFSLHSYLVYFFAGIFFFRYGLYRFFNSWLSVLLSAVVYIVCYVLDIPLLMSLCGILLMVSLSHQVARWRPALFSSFREYIYQIFLMSFIFQPFVELILWKKLFYCEQLFLLFYVLNVLSGIFMPVLVCKCVERTDWRWLKICLGLKP